MVINRLLRKILYLSPFIASLLAIALSAIFEKDFNIFNNALSDLGNPSTSSTASLFNLGLMISGLLGCTVSILARRAGYAYRVLLLQISTSVILVGFYNESYGSLHLYVAISAFTGMHLFTLLKIIDRSSKPIVRALISIFFASALTLWLTNTVVRIPKGIAIPETISILAFSISYIDVFIRSSQY